MAHLTRKAFVRMAARTGLGTVALGRLARAQTSSGSKTVEDGKNLHFSQGVTAQVVRFITSADIAHVPADVVEQAKRCLIDGFGVILAGSMVRSSAIVREYSRSSGGPGQATAFGAPPVRVPIEYAALLNGASGHAMDFDDTQLSTTSDRTFGLLTHPTVPALASSLALAEHMDVSGREFLQAFIIGFEVECKIAEAINPNHYNRGYHSTGTIGVFGAAAAAARLLNENPAVVSHTLAIAASLSAGIRVNFGTMTKPLHAGRAAQNGIFAARLASSGFTGGADGLDGEWGFFQVAGGGADTDRIAGVLGRPFTMVKPGVSVKPYPCGSLSHPSMDAMLKLVLDHDITADQVQSVRVRAGSNILEPLRYKTAKTELEAKFCLPFLMAVIILRRRAGIQEFTDSFVASTPVQQLMPRVETKFDPELEAQGFDKMRSVIEVRLTDGRSFMQVSDDRYRGGPDRPFTRDELHAKFRDCAAQVLPANRMTHALDLIESVDSLKSVRELVAAMSPA
ncbi:MAG TPA: MmgE/PrpD family protein [Vicinamibacterales bacterium]|jgi:2-methylcitrate dehydratase PrpD|nr:MmgE/PrpD family protein [Vicinamibacterales bacterium]